ncbi:MAG: hypothetical protein WD009_07000 [Phycisphaeraceae bacterium]
MDDCYGRRAGGMPYGAFKAFTVVVACAVTCLVAASTAHGRTYGDVTVTNVMSQGDHSVGGYLEYRFLVENRGSDDRTVTLRMPASSYGRGHHIREIRRTARVPATGATEMVLWQPPLPVNGGSVHVTIDGQGQRERVGVSIPNHGVTAYDPWGHSGNGGTILLSPAIDGGTRDHLERLLEGASSAGRYASGDRWSLVRAERHRPWWSEHWLGWTRYNTVMLAADELAGLPSAARDALRQYVMAGGTLIVLGEDPGFVPERWRGGSTSPPLTGSEVRAVGVGFGICWFVEAGAPDRWGSSDRTWLVDLIDHGGQPWNDVQTMEQANSTFSVIDELGVPIRGLLALMIVFAIAIGPVNLLLFARVNRRTWTLWTTPVIALVFSVAVFGYATLAEGWTATARVAGFTLLDESTRHATTLGWAGYYAPLTPRDGLRFDETTELTPQVRSDFWSNEGNARFVDWTNGQHLYAGWVQARVPAHFTVRNNEPRRERVTFSRGEDGQLQATNGLGVDIEQLHVADEAGRVYRASNLVAGGRADLEPFGEHQSGKDELPSLLDRTWPITVRHIAENASNIRVDILRPNTYIASLTSTPFIEPGLEDARVLPSPSVVYGLMQEPLRADQRD